MLRRLLFPVWVAVALLTGCQTSAVRTFDKLQVGMDKHQVLDVFGSPNATTRMHGRDRWMYRFYDSGIRLDKEVHFVDGISVYVGDVWNPPDKSAVAADERHAEKEKKIEAEIVAREEDRKKNAAMFMEYENESRGMDKVKYLPQFEELK